MSKIEKNNSKENETLNKIKENIVRYSDNYGKIPSITEYNREYKEEGVINYFLLENEISYTYLINDILCLVETSKGICGKDIFIKNLKTQIDCYYKINGRFPNIDELEEMNDCISAKEILGKNINNILKSLGYNIKKPVKVLKKIIYKSKEEYLTNLPGIVNDCEGTFYHFIPQKNLVIKVLNK
ncbi:MAG: hypothetical protein K0R54_603 [Clostridiaceae bacterium]|jgi:hypothetical protein|nr:hypothetical protein [Clostridiaceae bacterium]